MKKIYTTSEEFRIGQIESMLEQAGIQYIVRNQYLSGAVGELPPTECWPEIWIAHEEDFDEAMAIVKQATAPLENSGPWKCPCGEENEGQFGSCWKCGSDRPLED
jgi:hypothetical protein